jgi:hypothetical protein
MIVSRPPEAAARGAVIDKRGDASAIMLGPRNEWRTASPATATEISNPDCCTFEILEVRGICAILESAHGRPRGKERGKR